MLKDLFALVMVAQYHHPLAQFGFCFANALLIYLLIHWYGGFECDSANSHKNLPG